MSQSESAAPTLGLDLGGTKIAAGLVSADRRILAEDQCPTVASTGAEAVIERMAALARKVCAAAAVTPEALGHVGVAAAGQVNRVAGRVLAAPNLGWHDVDLGAALFHRLGVPVTVDNDVRAAALGEYLLGPAGLPRSMVVIYAGTGVGSGLILEGMLVGGASNCAGEIGHHIVDPSGPECPCGQRGCLESFASGTGTTRRARRLARDGQLPTILAAAGGDPEAIDGPLLGRLAAQGDPAALDLITYAGRYLGLGLANIVNILNPEVLVLGGGFLGVGPGLAAAATSEFERLVLPAARRGLTFRVSNLGRKASIVGAASLGRIGPGGRIL